MSEEFNERMLKSILFTQSASHQTQKMQRTIRRMCHKLGAKVWIEDGNVYAVKGNAEVFPCVVAHTDTVHKIVPQSQYRVIFEKGQYRAYNPSNNQPTGIGGDDKVGIYIALSALERFDNIKVAFFRDEEVGCIGAGKADVDFFSDVGYVFECDRRGHDDFIRAISGTTLMSIDFEKKIEPLLKARGYKYTSGSFTDVRSLKEKGIDICMANMSCGYHNPHSATEYIDRDQMMNCKSLVFELIEFLGENRFYHKSTKTYTPNYHNQTYGHVHKPRTFWKKEDRESAIADGWFRRSPRHSHFCDACGHFLGLFEHEQGEEEALCVKCVKRLAAVQGELPPRPLAVADILNSVDADRDDYLRAVGGNQCVFCNDADLKWDDTIEQWYCPACEKWFAADDPYQTRRIAPGVYLALPSGY